jgi:hypothetical protein
MTSRVNPKVKQYERKFYTMKKVLMITTLLILGFAVYQTNAQEYIVIEAEDFDDKQGESWQILEPPVTVMANPDSAERAPQLPVGTSEFGIGRASNGAFIGNPDRSGANNDWVKYEFNVPTEGDWYFWALVVAPTIGDNSWFIGIDINDAEAVSEDNDNMNIWDFHESAETPDDTIGTPLNTRFTTDWVWFRLNSRTGNPFPGTEVEQYGPNPTPLPLTVGVHTFHFAWREHSYCDVIFATMDASEHPIQAGVAVQPVDKLTSTWAKVKQTK